MIKTFNIIKKSVIVFILAALVLTLCGCGKKNDVNNEGGAPDVTQQTDDQNADNQKDKNNTYKNNDDSIDNSNDNIDSSNDVGNSNIDVDNSNEESQVTGEDVGSMIDKFNSTDDPEEKEKLGEELQRIFDQAEKAVE